VIYDPGSPDGSSTIFYVPTTPEVALEMVENWESLRPVKEIKDSTSVQAGDYYLKSQ
jgi:hypothetical protein